MRYRKLIILVLFVIGGTFCPARNVVLRSPNGANQIVIEQSGDSLLCRISRHNKYLLSASMAICVDDGQQWGKHGLSKNAVYRTVNDSISFVVPRKYKRVSNSYNEIILRYPNYDIEFRAYNDGLAYRFCGNQKKVKSIEKEVNCYQFPADYIAYTLPVGKLQNWFEENYCVRPLSEQACDSFSIIPVMVKTEGVNVVLAEANVHNYPNLYLRPNGHGFDNLQAAYPKVEEVVEGGNKIYVMEREDYLVRTNLNRSFPWRVTGLFDNDVDILNSELIYLLSDQTSSDFSWVKPGQVLWDWWNHNNIVGVDFKAGINTPTYLSMIDFAARNGVPYVLIDEGWSAYDSLLKLNPEVDMPEICAYAKAKGVGIMLWAKWVNVEKSLDEAFELMHQWDVKGVKIDFMDRNDAKMNDFYERVLEKAATYGLMIDLHGSYPNSGLRAKYPNLMTREGVLGMEYDKWSNRATVEHDLMIPYLRMWVGPMDYTPGAMLNANQDVFVYNAIEPMSQGTRVHQMAMYVVYESPLQMLSDSQTNYANNQECFDFIKQIPVVWDYTQGLAGSIGHDIAIARRSGNKWYVGVMAGFKTQLSSIDLSFLPIGRYRMTSFADGVNVEQNAKDYCKEVQEVESGNILDIHLAQGGGFVACFEPIGN